MVADAAMWSIDMGARAFAPTGREAGEQNEAAQHAATDEKRAGTHHGEEGLSSFWRFFSHFQVGFIKGRG